MPFPLSSCDGPAEAPLLCSHEIQPSHSRMKIVTLALALAAILAAVMLWTSRIKDGWPSTAVLLGAGFGLVLLVFLVALRLRNRQQRRRSDKRDSALW